MRHRLHRGLRIGQNCGNRVGMGGKYVSEGKTGSWGAFKDSEYYVLITGGWWQHLLRWKRLLKEWMVDR